MPSTGPRAALARAWLRARERVQLSEETFHLLLAGGVGVLGGLANLAFDRAIKLSQRVFLGHTGDPVLIAESLSPWARLLAPTVGGLVAGLVLQWGVRVKRERESNNILEVVVAGDGRLPFASGLVKSLSSLLSIGSGSSIGKEGGIVELAATLSSRWGQLAAWPPYRLRLLVGCGAASGIAAAYNAPISGAVFASLIVLGNFSMNLFAPLVVSSVVATVVSRAFFGIRPAYTPPQFEFTSVAELPWFIPLGIVCGAIGALFLKLLLAGKGGFKRLSLPLPVKLMLGGLVVGAISLRVPGVWGNGYQVTNRLFQGEYLRHANPLLFVLGLLLAKLGATVAAVGSGAEGGVFTPTLFLGASTGTAFGLGLHRMGAGTGLPVPVFALVGMGSMLAATTRSPLLAMIMAFEISLDYSLMPPLMLGCVVSVLAARRLHPSSIYTEPLRKAGLHAIQESDRSGAALERTVGDVMQRPVPPVRATAPLAEVRERFLNGSVHFLPVVDDGDRLVGLVALHDLKAHLAGDDFEGVIADDVMRPPMTVVTPKQRLLDVLPTLIASEQRNVPVVSSLQDYRLVGALVRAEVLGLFSEAIAEGAAPTGHLDDPVGEG